VDEGFVTVYVLVDFAMDFICVHFGIGLVSLLVTHMITVVVFKNSAFLAFRCLFQKFCKLIIRIY